MLSDTDLDKVREAIARAESSNAGEIVPYLVGRVDDHDEARWRGATLCALMAALVAGIVHTYSGLWLDFSLVWITLPTIIGAGLGYIMAGHPAIGRALLTGDDIDRRVKWRAEAAFLEEEIFRTRDRTGILIFLAIYEHRALILADEGINRAVPNGLWQSLVDDLVRGIREGRTVAALCDTIERCGQVLQEYDVEKRADDRDELINGLRIRES
ncbi:MAG: hypothetical protein U9N50_06280 [Pseudomonadota bacterium]|nr:hypothetical protein [Pseudomonadota bacterium]